ncbi:ribosome maturation factor RimP [Colibacter massiliensis]|uniref:ribosome maturation factor RimP n=1 Tax=Colibacter massiliensis TaxID=1852379 RepID=UPI00094F1540|nr:ribosome maturation factor RimP [Colibacter massiliensis]
MKRSDIENLVAREAEQIIAGTDLELVDVEYVRERDWYLRVFIDKEGGVGLEDCQAVSEKLSKVLDAKDPIADNYLLEVSSPGLDRVLKKDADFVRYKGRDVDVHFFKPRDGMKMIVAVLVGKSGDTVRLSVDGAETDIERKEIAQIRLHVDF